MIYKGKPLETGVKFGCHRTPNCFAALDGNFEIHTHRMIKGK